MVILLMRYGADPLLMDSEGWFGRVGGGGGVSMCSEGGYGSGFMGCGSGFMGMGVASWGVGVASWGVGVASWGMGVASWGVGVASWGVGVASWVWEWLHRVWEWLCGMGRVGGGNWDFGGWGFLPPHPFPIYRCIV